MSKQKRVFLYVSGEDYSARVFDDNYVSQDYYEDMLSSGVQKKIIDDDVLYAEVKIVEFDEVDEKFITFIRNNFMENQSKDSNLFEVKPIKP